MNDLEEMRFGLNQGTRLFNENETVKAACGSPHRAEKVREAYMHYYNQFDSEHAINVYVFCLSEHDSSNCDGVLSMWRGYGGQGNGAALVFNTNFVVFNAASPLIVAKVKYASVNDRLKFLISILEEWSKIVSNNSIPDDKLHLAAYQLFSVIKLFALTSKHNGFSEEREWRVIYMPERDIDKGLLKDRLHYVIGSRGVEPKLRFKLAPLPGYSNATWSLATILDRIILGPSVSFPLAKSSVVRMLETMGKSEFGPLVFPSGIPLRPV